MSILSQILGFLAFSFYLLSIQYQDKKKILKVQLISNVFYTVSYALIGALPAVLIDIVSGLRCILYNYFDRKKKVPLLIMLSLIILTCLIGVITVKDFFDILPIIISIIYIITTYQKKIRIIQIGYIMAACLWIVYNLHVKMYTPLMGNIFEIVSGTVAILRTKKMK